MLPTLALPRGCASEAATGSLRTLGLLLLLPFCGGAWRGCAGRSGRAGLVCGEAHLLAEPPPPTQLAPARGEGLKLLLLQFCCSIEALLPLELPAAAAAAGLPVDRAEPGAGVLGEAVPFCSFTGRTAGLEVLPAGAGADDAFKLLLLLELRPGSNG